MTHPDLLSTEDRLILDLGKLGYPCVKVLGQYNYRQMRRSLEMHRHVGMLEICYLEKGTQYYHVQGKDYRMKGGDVLLTFPGEEHGTRDFPEEKGRLFWLIILLPGPVGKQRLLNLTKEETKEMIDRLLHLQSNRMFHGSALLKNHLNRIFQVYREQDSLYKKIQITNLLLGFLIHVVELGERATENQVSETISQVCRFIQQNIHDELSLESLASQWNLSLSHFKYRFKKETGIPPADYIVRQKIAMAKELLAGGCKVHDVAYRLAFSSPSYFATVFKRYSGKTPTRYTREKLNISHPSPASQVA